MSYPATWRPFLRDVFLKSEGGYVKTGSMHTLFGVIDRVWVDAIDRVPDGELTNLPELLRIKHLPESQRMAPMRAWMQSIGRELQPMGNGKQPESGQPLRSKEWAEAGGNKALVHRAQEVALGIIHRDYIVGGHFDTLPLSQETLCTVIDAAGRYGVAAAWTMVTKAARLSGYITERQMNELGYTESKDMRAGDTYDKDGGGGYNYTVVSKRKAVGDAMKLMHDSEMDSRFFDAYGFWRRNYVSNHTPVNEREGDMLRVEHQHPNTSAALARMAEWRTDRPENAAITDARIAAKSGGLVQGTTQLAGANAGGSVISMQLGDPKPAAEVYIQNARQSGWFNKDYGTLQLAIEIPGHGVVHYGLKETRGMIRPEGSDKYELGDVMLLDPKKIYAKPPGVHVVPPGKRALGVTNPFTDATLLVWKDAEGKVQPLVLTPEMHRGALAISMRYEWAGLAYADDFATVGEGANKRLDPKGSAILNFGKGLEGLTQHMVFVEHPAGEVPTPGLKGNMRVTSVVDTMKASQTVGPLASR